MIFDEDRNVEALDPSAVEGIELKDDKPVFNDEDLEHLEQAVFDIQEFSNAIALPGLEAVYYKVALMVSKTQAHYLKQRTLERGS